MKRSDAIDRLHAIRDTLNRDPEVAHSEADAVLLLLAGPEVETAYRDVAAACKWWAYA